MIPQWIGKGIKWGAGRIRPEFFNAFSNGLGEEGGGNAYQICKYQKIGWG